MIGGGIDICVFLVGGFSLYILCVFFCRIGNHFLGGREQGCVLCELCVFLIK